MAINRFCFFLFFLFFLIFNVNALNFSISTVLNGMSTEIFLLTKNDCTSSIDNYDFEIPDNPDDYSLFFSLVNERNLSVDCWNPSLDQYRNFNLSFVVLPPGNYTGQLFVSWPPQNLYSSNYFLDCILVDYVTGSRINMSTQSFVVFSNFETKRNFSLETRYYWCGDGIKNLNEECDGLDLGGQDCQTKGFAYGNLSCNAQTCRFDVTRCYTQTGSPGQDDGSVSRPSGGGFPSGGGGNNFCLNECNLMDRRCFSNNTFQLCGNFDSDVCYEWGIVEKCLGINPFCKDGFCYGCLSDDDCDGGFCINGKCEYDCNKNCKELGLECGNHYICRKLINCGICKDGFCNGGKCSKIYNQSKKIANFDCNPNYVCSPWSECKVVFDFESLLLGESWFKGSMERICQDKNKCYSTIKETQDCMAKKDVFFKETILCGKNYLEVFDKKTNSLLARIKDSRYTTKSTVEIFLLPKNVLECEEIFMPYKISLWDRFMFSLNLRKIWRLFYG